MRATRHISLRWVLVPEAANPGVAVGHSVPLDPEKLKHLRKVLRMEWDEPLRVIDGKGRLYDACLEKNGERGSVRLLGLVRQETTFDEIELAICLPKNSTMDWVVEKAVECGVHSIVPVVSSRSVVRPDDSGKHERRWQAIMDGALEQSEQLWRPIIASPVAWKEWVQQPSSARVSVAFVSEARESSDLNQTWNVLRESKGKPVRILIGPEGGLSEAERHELVQRGFVEVTLGPMVFRVETAVVSALSLLRVARNLS